MYQNFVIQFQISLSLEKHHNLFNTFLPENCRGRYSSKILNSFGFTPFILFLYFTIIKYVVQC